MSFKLLVLVSMGCAMAQAQPVIPDTPAGRTLNAWMEAFNSGDRARLVAYHAKHEPEGSVDRSVSFREQTGGFDLLAIELSERLHIEFRVKEKGRATEALGKIDVKDSDPPVVASFGLRAIPKGMSAADMKLKIDAATRSRVIDGAVEKLNEYYIFPETAKKMEEAVRTRQKRGAYDAVSDGDAFATMLTSDFQEVSHDKHLRVGFVPSIVPKEERRPTPEDEAGMRARMERENCLFEKVERMASNIGYLKFNGFMDPEICGPTATAAMNFLGNVDAIIFDMRDNDGGDPKMVSYVTSYLFAERTHLNDLYDRRQNSTEEYWTQPNLPGKKLAGKPVFILTSKRTFSGAEEFTYNLKNLKRATIIGETTGGGAHPVSGHRIDDHFTIGVPFARAINPISKTNWEGTGVEPDVKVPAAEALEVAKKMAAEQIRKR